MAQPHSYCLSVRQGRLGSGHRTYHDLEYGFRIEDDDALFGRLLLEINQAGLSWDTIIRKREGIRSAYSDFNIRAVANYGEQDEERLLNDVRIVRNRLKVKAAIYNANVLLEIIQSQGSFSNWLDVHHPMTAPQWVKLFKSTFKFTGGEITKSFLISTGYLPGAHDADCPVFKVAALTGPRWMDMN